MLSVNFCAIAPPSMYAPCTPDPMSAVSSHVNQPSAYVHEFTCWHRGLVGQRQKCVGSDKCLENRDESNLKSASGKPECRFESGRGHQKPLKIKYLAEIDKGPGAAVGKATVSCPYRVRRKPAGAFSSLPRPLAWVIARYSPACLSWAIAGGAV